MKSNVDLYLNADRTTVVLEGDPAAASLLVNAGREIPDAEVTAMGAGIFEQAQKLGNPETEAPAENKQKAPVEDKAVKAPAENKADDKGDEKSK